MIGKIERVDLREVWPHEAYDFTTWLEDNIDILNDELGLSIDNVNREQNAGSFSVDLVAKDRIGNTIVIENQLERSNHDHLGKLITYTSALNANIAVWIVKEPREEHTKAIVWLNESSSTAFYLVKVEAIRIGDSAPAPLLTLITGPSDEVHHANATKKELTEQQNEMRRFWSQLLEKSNKKTRLHSNVSPGQASWLASGSGLPEGLSLVYATRMHDARIELYIDSAKYGEEGNMKLFRFLKSNKTAIEAAFSEELTWQELPGKRACRIRKDFQLGGRCDIQKWPEIQNTLVDAMIRFERALRPYLEKIDEALFLGAATETE